MEKKKHDEEREEEVKKKKKKEKKEISSDEESEEVKKKKKKKKKEISSNEESEEEVKKKKKKKKKEISSDEESEEEVKKKIYIQGVYNHKIGKQSIEDIINIVGKSSSTCKILLENDYGSGFFSEIIKGGKSTKVLITCNHVINKDFLLSNNEINIEINKQNKKIDLVNREIWTNEDIDYTCIQILNSDKIEQFLEANEDLDEIFKKNFEYDKLIKEEIILIAYNRDDKDNQPKQSSEFGIIINFKKKNFFNNYNSSLGSSGGAILLKKNYKLIGIYAGGIREKNVFIPINIIINDMNTNTNSIVNLNKGKGYNEKNNELNNNKINFFGKDDNKIIENIFINKNKEEKEEKKEKKEKKYVEDKNKNKENLKNIIDENENNNIEEFQEFLSSDIINKNSDNLKELLKEMSIIPYCKNCNKDYQRLPALAIQIVVIIIKSLKCDYCGKQNFGVKLPYEFNMKCNCGLQSKQNFPFSSFTFKFLFSLKNISQECGKCGQEYKIIAIEDDNNKKKINEDKDNIQEINNEKNNYNILNIKNNLKEAEKNNNEILIVQEIIKNKKIKKKLFSKLDIVGDGNCFYRCIAKKLMGDENKYKDIKGKITKNIDKKNFLDYKDKYIKKEALKIYDENAWAGDLAIFLAKKTFDVNIIILFNDNENKEYYSLYICSDMDIDIEKQNVFILYGNINSDLDYGKDKENQVFDKRNHYSLLIIK